MDCLKLAKNADVSSYTHIRYGAEYSLFLGNSLVILQKENHFRKCYYWGRINGYRNDYHIAYGFERDCMLGQVYYYSTNGLNWLLMPRPTKSGRFLTPIAINEYEGDPSFATNVARVNPPFPPNTDATLCYGQPIPNILTEEDRLATTVELIQEDAVIIPRGAWMKQPNGDVVENVNFEGLCSADATYLKSYLHARPPQQKWNTNLLTRPDYNYAFDFLDSIDCDVPQGCWDLQCAADNLIILRNLYWPGMTFYHKMNSPHYGFLYIGNGKKNIDIPFMV